MLDTWTLVCFQSVRFIISDNICPELRMGDDGRGILPYLERSTMGGKKGRQKRPIDFAVQREGRGKWLGG